MIKTRVIETNQGIQGELMTDDFDKFQKKLRDKGFINTDQIIESGIISGKVLEIGPGPGYLGLEWLKKTQSTFLYGLEISPDMKKLAEKNAQDYQLTSRAKYSLSDAKKLPYDNDFFDGVFTNGSLHEWSEPLKIFNEIARVLKPNGIFFISDLKRNMSPLITLIMKQTTGIKSIRKGVTTSKNAAYTKNEIEILLSNSDLKNFTVKEHPFGIDITGVNKLD